MPQILQLASWQSNTSAAALTNKTAELREVCHIRPDLDIEPQQCISRAITLVFSVSEADGHVSLTVLQHSTLGQSLGLDMLLRGL